MKKNQPRFDVRALRDNAGDKIFARGEAYHRDGAVEILVLGRDRVVAQVAGTEDYRTVVTGRGTAIGGECSCPAFSDWGFCKHMVAVALAANAAGDDGEAEHAGTFARIREHLRTKGVDALVDMIVELAERDPALLRRLDLAAVPAGPDRKAHAGQLRKMLDRATRVRDYVEYQAAADWADGVGSVLDTVADLAAGPDAGLAVELALHAIDRIEEAVESIDDSDGHCGALLERSRDIHLAALRAVRPDPVRLAHDLFAREMEGGDDTFAGAVGLYADVLGESGIAAYRRLASEAWEKLPRRIAGRKSAEGGDDYERLMDILDIVAEREGDVETRIALRTKNLASPWNYLQLAEFCRAHERTDEALRWAEEGLWIFEDGRADERLASLVVDLLVKAGRKAEAEDHLWRLFDKQPSLDIYKRLLKVGGPAVRDRALAGLEERAARKESHGFRSTADLLVEILMQEKEFDAAWRAVRAYGASLYSKEALARASERSHPAAALEIYLPKIDQLVAMGGNQNYADAVELIKRVGTLRAPIEQKAYVSALKVRHARKRNFIKLLG